MNLPSEKTIFLQALEKESDAERVAFLDQACAENASLRASVEELLTAHFQPNNALDVPAAKWNSPSVDLLEDTLIGDRNASELTGTLIDDYRLMEQIVEGGFGLVSVAEQQHRRRPIKYIYNVGIPIRLHEPESETPSHLEHLLEFQHGQRVLEAVAHVVEIEPTWRIRGRKRPLHPLIQFTGQSRIGRKPGARALPATRKPVVAPPAWKVQRCFYPNSFRDTNRS